MAATFTLPGKKDPYAMVQLQDGSNPNPTGQYVGNKPQLPAPTMPAAPVAPLKPPSGGSSGSGSGGSGGSNNGNSAAITGLTNLYNQIAGRSPFRYDLQADLLYQQAADQYTQLGQQAMRNTMGQAAALTGGYGNSYASTAGNQAFQQYLAQLNSMIPQFYNSALSAYQAETDRLKQLYDLTDKHYSNLKSYSNSGGGGGGRENLQDEEDDKKQGDDGTTLQDIIDDLFSGGSDGVGDATPPITGLSPIDLYLYDLWRK